ncbi:Rapid ALkalinization Factor (RALF) [Musa troglodytarum]|uniref:Rapid ALkalinization Factor (RALF) n=1 Tax=Musa troglodytarum TaxID=320322 RepID=A0A9E7G5J8_9LILI|nr:Rapid ALkalinization Factor (RALF) [Musa troglodytarum]
MKCLAGDEFEQETEMANHILAHSYYINYNALKHTSIPCSHHGTFYYNSYLDAQANPYSRSCSTITYYRR